MKVVSNSLTNTPDTQSQIWLVELQNLFARQLPEMPKSYITRFVFDPYVYVFIIIFLFSAYCIVTFKYCFKTNFEFFVVVKTYILINYLHS